MRVGVEADVLYRYPRSGITKTLVDLYRSLGELYPDWHFVMFHQFPWTDTPFLGLPNIELARLEVKGDRFKGRIDLWKHVRLPLACRWWNVDVLHCPASTAPRHPSVPMVVTIHDLNPLYSSPALKQVKRWTRNVEHAARKSRRVLTGSGFAKAELVRHLGILPQKIVITHWAPSERYRPVRDKSELNRVRQKYGLGTDRPYVLHFGSQNPGKGTLKLLDAWASLSDSIRSTHALLVVGVEEPAIVRLRDYTRSRGVAGSCTINGTAAETDMPALLSGAIALCYPSIAEGFGMPVVEAFACETPVLTSKATSLPEVADHAALLIDPTDVDSIRSGLAKLLVDGALRADLVERGRDRVRAFSWERCARKTSEVLEEAARSVAPLERLRQRETALR